MFKKLLFLLPVVIILSFQKAGFFSDPLVSIADRYHANIRAFDAQVLSLQSMALGFQIKEISQEDFQHAVISARAAYKKIEPYVEYFHREAITKFINGAPLPKLETAAPEHNIVEPAGLQMIDETAFLSEGYEAADELVELTEKLDRFWKDLSRIEAGRKLQHRYIIEAWRYQIIRIYTLGLTGFDTPGSVGGIDESIVSLEEMIAEFATYNEMPLEQAATIHKRIMSVASAFKSYLIEHNDFDTLDRLFVLREFVNPLYAMLYDFQEAVNIEFVDEVDRTLKAVNYHAQGIFSNDFLNKSFYAQVAKSDLEDPKKVALGKTLFYDPVLSRNMKMSCATCHDPKKAFTDGKAKSSSNKRGVTTLRNSPTLLNSVYAEKYFYDLREYDLERQVKHVVYDEKEFNMDFIELADRLKLSAEYVNLFKEAYGDRDKYGISSWSISNALAAYVASLSSWNSPFDKYARGESDVYSDQARLGYNLFMGKAACGTCHFAPTFNGTVPPHYVESESEVLGVPTKPDTIGATIDPDPGRIANGRMHDEVPHFLHAFKTTTARNAALTAPYMHNGVYETLEEVVDFYNRGGGAGIGSAVDHQTLPGDPLGLTQHEMTAIVSFLKTLTDTTGLTSVSHHFPLFGIDSIDARSY